MNKRTIDKVPVTNAANVRRTRREEESSVLKYYIFYWLNYCINIILACYILNKVINACKLCVLVSTKREWNICIDKAIS